MWSQSLTPHAIRSLGDDHWHLLDGAALHPLNDHSAQGSGALPLNHLNLHSVSVPEAHRSTPHSGVA